jgi:hypothetical protein
MGVVKSGTVGGKRVEVHEDSHGQRRYWAQVDKSALFQRGRMRLRTFTTADAAWKAALAEAKARA